jgi:hypothetical protein
MQRDWISGSFAAILATRQELIMRHSINCVLKSRVALVPVNWAITGPSLLVAINDGYPVDGTISFHHSDVFRVLS